MMTFREWFEANYEGEKLPEKTISGDWFAEHHLPMIVACTCCGSTMALPSALINVNDECYCSNCVEW